MARTCIDFPRKWKIGVESIPNGRISDVSATVKFFTCGGSGALLRGGWGRAVLCLVTVSGLMENSLENRREIFILVMSRGACTRA